MAYTICDLSGNCKPIRLVSAYADGSVFVAKPFTPEWWSCDPCAHSRARYTVDFGCAVQTYAWYEVIQSDDDERTMRVKTDFALEVAQARQCVEDAKQNLRKLVG